MIYTFVWEKSNKDSLSGRSCFTCSRHELVIKDSHLLLPKFVLLIELDLLIFFAKQRLDFDTSGTSDSKHNFALVSKLLIIKFLWVDYL